MPGRNTRRRYTCREPMSQNTDSAEFRRSVVDSDVEASHRRYGTERADQRRRPLQPRRKHAAAKKPHGKEVKGGKDPRHKNRLQVRTNVGKLLDLLVHIFSERAWFAPPWPLTSSHLNTASFYTCWTFPAFLCFLHSFCASVFSICLFLFFLILCSVFVYT